MEKQNIENALLRLVRTFSSGPMQTTIVELKNGRFNYGFFPMMMEVEENTNKWKFVLFNDKYDEIILEGDDIISISLEEEGKRIYYKSGTEELNQLHSSKHVETVSLNETLIKLNY